MKGGRIRDTMDQRKVIRQGKGTLTMSLPTSWVKEVGIKAGSDLFIERKGLKLLVSPSFSQKPPKRTEVDLRPFDHCLVNPILYNLYIRGDEEILFRFGDPKAIRILNQRVHDLLGLEIIEQTPTTCTLKVLAQGETDQFDSILRRLFLILVGLAEDGHAALKAKNIPELDTVRLRENTVNTLVAYCLRMLNRRGGTDIQRSMHLYCLLNFFEQLGDAYARYYRDAGPIKPSTINLNEKVTSLIRDFYELFYQFEPIKASALKNKRDKIREKIDAGLRRPSGRNDLAALHHMRLIADLIVDIEKFCLAMQVN